MVNPYLERRTGAQTVTYPHPSLEPILKRTLGVPLFQEQLIRMAMVAAGFSGGQAEELRRAMGFKRSVERMDEIENDLRAGMARNGIAGAAQEEIVAGIKSFALYGFPESHAASFALLAYASAYLKAHHPAAFLCALLNNWPMGFYHPATLVTDAVRHGVERAADRRDAARAGCAISRTARRAACGWACATSRGLHEAVGRRIEAARAERPFASLADFARARRRRAPTSWRAWPTSARLAALGGTRRAGAVAGRGARALGRAVRARDRPTATSPLPRDERRAKRWRPTSRGTG